MGISRVVLGMLVAVLAACSNMGGSETEQVDTIVPTQLDAFGVDPSPLPVNVAGGFSWTVYGTRLTCKLDVDNNGVTDYTVENCTSASRVWHTYGNPGVYVAVLTVNGADGRSENRRISVNVGPANRLPVIPQFGSDYPASGSSPLAVMFRWRTTDADGDNTWCRLDAESDGVWEYVGPCTELGTTFQHTYRVAGKYRVTVEAYDPYGMTMAIYEIRAPYNRDPIINELTGVKLDSTTGRVAFRVSDGDGDRLTCKLYVETIGTFWYENCSTLMRTYTFSEPGTYEITLSVTDGRKTSSRTIYIEIGTGRPPFPPDVRVSVSAGWYFTCALLNTGDGYCWGDNPNYQVGNGGNVEVGSPSLVQQGARPDGVYFTTLSAGDEFACGTASDGEAYCWGLNAEGQLGDGTNTTTGAPVRVAQGDVPSGVRLVQISGGVAHTCALGSDGNAYCWGKGDRGRLGAGDEDWSNTPRRVVQGERPGGVKFTQVSAGYWHSCGLGSDGAIYCWGANESGTLGDGSTDNSSSPVKVLQGVLPGGVKYVVVAAFTASETVCGLGDNGRVYCWGSGVYGELGNGKDLSNCPATDADTYCSVGSQVYYEMLPRAVQMPAGITFTTISEGDEHICAIGEQNGLAYCWGRNDNAEIGIGTETEAQNVPALTNQGARPSGATYLAVGGGGHHSCGVLNTQPQSVVCWGSGGDGQLGDSQFNDSTEPVLAVFP